MIEKALLIADDTSDDVTPILNFIRDGGPWNGKKARVKSKLIDELKRAGAISFEGHYTRYHMSQVGESYLYDVPLYKRGHLAGLRGKRVRIICTDSGRYSRGYAAYAVSDTPPELIIEKPRKPVIHYQFPDWASEHTSIYRSKRYRVIPLACVPSEIWQQSRQEIDFGDSLWAMLDGRTQHLIALGKQTDDLNVGLHYFNPRRLSKGTTFAEALKQFRKDHSWISGISYADD